MVVLVTCLNKLYKTNASRKQTYPRTTAYVTNTNTNVISVPIPTLKGQEESPLSYSMGKRAVKVQYVSRQGLTTARPQICPMGGIKAPPLIQAPGI